LGVGRVFAQAIARVTLRTMGAAIHSRSIQTCEASFAFGVWVFVSLIALAILLAIVGAPLALANGHSILAGDIYKGFSYLCHQLPDRSFHLAGHQFAVCSRCTGLYVGFALTTLAYPLIRPIRATTTPALIWLILATVPLLIDFSLGYFNIWANTYASRFITGLLLSSVAVFYIIPGLVEITSNIFKQRSIS
jgi:uncharacterized membrane protein